MYKLHHLAVSLLCVLATVISLHAITDPVESVESLGFQYGNYRYHDYAGIYIDSATPVHNNQNIFLLAEIAGGRVTQSRRDDFNHLGLELGLKYQMLPVSSIAILGSYDWFLGSPDYGISAAHIRLRQGLVPHDSPVIPFLRANGSIQFVSPSRQSPARQAASYRMLVLEALAGVEVRMRQDFRWVFEGGRSQSKAINNDGPDIANGWIARVAMRYDWF